MIRYLTLALALAVGPAFAAPALATDLNWDWENLGSGSATAKHRRSMVRYVHRRHRARSSDSTRVMAYVRREEARKEDDGYQCVGPVRGLGTQWIGTEGAMDAAKKDWMERVRYDHGESYVDMSNAREFETRCGRVSIGEIAGQVTYRCEVIARPCKPPLKEVKVEPKGK
jgi:hypothetical protein